MTPPNEAANAAPCFYLVRHGGTEWTLSGRHTGRTDIPLTAVGEDEARQWSETLSRIPFSRVLTSPRQRARQTCDLVGLATTAEIEPDLAEWDYGDYEGLRSVDIIAARPGWNLYRDGCPNGEDPAQVSARADRLIVRLRAMDGNIALFSHGQFGAVLGARWIGLPVMDAQHLLLGTASLSILGNDPRHHGVPVIMRWNSASHSLSGADSLLVDAQRASMREQALQRWENEGGSDAVRSETCTRFLRGSDGHRRSLP